MSRLTDAILTGGYASDITNPMLDVKNAGYMGWAPDLTNYVSNAAYVSRPLTCILLEAPKMFNVFPNSEKWISCLKNLIEVHAKSVEGFNATLKVDTEEHAVGGAGEQHQEVVNVTRERTTPKFTFTELYGRPIQTFLDYWIRYGLMDPDTKYALLSTLNDSSVKDMLTDWYSATCLFFVTDPLHKNIDKAWITTNMYPLTTGDITAKRDLTTAQEILTLDVDFSGISQFGLGVNKFAQEILDNINTRNADPYMRASFVDRISSDVSAIDGVGYKNTVEETGKAAVGNFSGGSAAGSTNGVGNIGNVIGNVLNNG